jgi:hypothetical protein
VQAVCSILSRLPAVNLLFAKRAQILILEANLSLSQSFSPLHLFDQE